MFDIIRVQNNSGKMSLHLRRSREPGCIRAGSQEMLNGKKVYFQVMTDGEVYAGYYNNQGKNLLLSSKDLVELFNLTDDIVIADVPVTVNGKQVYLLQTALDELEELYGLQRVFNNLLESDQPEFSIVGR